MSSRKSFFQPGSRAAHPYVDMRDMPRLAEARRFVEELWVEYRPLADGHFCADARNHFLQRLWEMYLAVTLKRVATVSAVLTVGFSLSEPDSYEAIPAGHAIANNARTHGQQTTDRGYPLFSLVYWRTLMREASTVINFPR